MTEPQKPVYRPRLKLPNFLDEALRTVLFIIVVTVLFDMAIPRSLVDGRSMQPTFENGERLIVSRVHYLVREPLRGDVVVFNSLDPNEIGIMLIKRVVGLPGEEVKFIDQQLHINDQLVDEPYILEACRQFSCDSDEVWALGENEYFVMGDNRNNSQDSRRFGPVPIENVVGHVVFRYWPPLRVGIVGERSYDIDR